MFDAYPKRTRVARHAGLLTGLPDAYGRGRIIGDYRRVALYGLDRLVAEKKKDLDALDGPMTEDRIRAREEVSMQIRALGEIKSMALKYGVDLSQPAGNAREAFQAVYFAYLAGIKENNGAATSLGRTSTFLDIYIPVSYTHLGNAKDHQKKQVDQNKRRAAVLPYNIGKPPYVAQPDGAACRNQDKSQPRAEPLSFLHKTAPNKTPSTITKAHKAPSCVLMVSIPVSYTHLDVYKRQQ